jgi:hypothetical protein
MAFVKSYSHLIAARFFLGVAEAGLFPVSILTSCDPLVSFPILAREPHIICPGGILATFMEDGLDYS